LEKGESMPITYTNCKGVTYYLYHIVTTTGTSRYVFAREPKGEPLDEVPQGWHISESVDGVVSLARDRPQQIRPEEVASVEAEIRRHPKSHNYRVAVKENRIEVYERIGPGAEDLLTGFTLLRSEAYAQRDELQAILDRHAQFTPVLRFILTDDQKRTFRTQRWCYLGSIDDWIEVGPTGQLSLLARQWTLRLGTDAFFEVYR
jgi:hypothetical protein